MRRRRPLQVRLVRGGAAVGAAVPGTLLAGRTLAALVEGRGHVADLVCQHVLLHVALVRGAGLVCAGCALPLSLYLTLRGVKVGKSLTVS